MPQNKKISLEQKTVRQTMTKEFFHILFSKEVFHLFLESPNISSSLSAPTAYFAARTRYSANFYCGTYDILCLLMCQHFAVLLCHEGVWRFARSRGGPRPSTIRSTTRIRRTRR